ncbi:hypothetical protein [Phreatobacter stygius]|uniref:Uncharacterized protein n=1 Tax=Phreatobacter stygius TaxID=1940610 RepID=A0A4D7B5Q1_9HYPH|nr:hypothetical protein [Phreatobacter stygius]QCI66313.1 hypothetical protein E8M01_20080 [Phreatobacter stygius]
MHILAILVVLLLGGGQSRAMSGLSCTVDDRDLKLEVSSGLNGAGGGLFEFGGELQLLQPSAPTDFRKLTLGAGQVMQSWLSREELKLELYWERPAGRYGFLRIVIETRAIEEASYRGSYVLTTYQAAADSDAAPVQTETRGAASCSVG